MNGLHYEKQILVPPGSVFFNFNQRLGRVGFSRHSFTTWKFYNAGLKIVSSKRNCYCDSSVSSQGLFKKKLSFYPRGLSRIRTNPNSTTTHLQRNEASNTTYFFHNPLSSPKIALQTFLAWSASRRGFPNTWLSSPTTSSQAIVTHRNLLTTIEHFPSCLFLNGIFFDWQNGWWRRRSKDPSSTRSCYQRFKRSFRQARSFS